LSFLFEEHRPLFSVIPANAGTQRRENPRQGSRSGPGGIKTECVPDLGSRLRGNDG
jgi:hypothetical protein